MADEYINGPSLQGKVISLLLDPQWIPLLKTTNCSTEQEEELGILFCSAWANSSNPRVVLSLKCPRLCKQMQHTEITSLCFMTAPANKVWELITLKNSSPCASLYANKALLTQFITICIDSVNSLLLKPFLSPLSSFRRWRVTLRLCGEVILLWRRFHISQDFKSTPD